MKKATIIMAILLGMLICTSCGKDGDVSTKESEVKKVTHEPNINELTHVEIVSYVDQQVKEAIELDDFQEGNVDARAQILQSVLDRLKNGGYIEGYKYYPESSYPQIIIEYTGGGSITVVLEDTPKDENK